jgi:hypothetical protein
MKHLKSIKFKVGDTVLAYGQPGYIVDILSSEETDSVVVAVKFAHNFGNARQWDNYEMIEGKVSAVTTWEVCDKQIYFDAMQKRIDDLQKEFDELKSEMQKEHK